MDLELVVISASAALTGAALGGLLVWSRLAARCERLEGRLLAEEKLWQQRLLAAESQLVDERQEVGRLRAEEEELRGRLAREIERRAAAEEKNGRIPVLEAAGRETAGRLTALQEALAALKAREAELSTLLDEERRQGAEKLALLEDARQRLGLEFKELGQRIYEEKSSRFTEQNRQQLEGLLGPVREQLREFRQRIDDVYDRESKDRLSLFHEIGNLKDLNQRISVEAENLTRALKGESKSQGVWGEIVLERLLEISGLRRGREYETQESLLDDSGRSRRPDVVVHLPGGRQVIVDAKVSLTAYERYCAADGEEERSRQLRLHLGSLRAHIKTLGDKRYSELQGVQSLDFVVLFLPVEPAFHLAVQAEPGLFAEAFENSILLASPSTLLAVLRTVHNLWRYDDQNRNAREIARRGGELYDKFVGFVEALQDVGAKLDRAREAYQMAYGRLATGRGNLVRRAGELRELGVKNHKELPAELRLLAEGEDERAGGGDDA